MGKIAEITVLKTIEDPVKTQTTICGWAPPQYSDLGESALHTVLSVVAFAVAVWSAYEQMRIFNMRYKLAEAYADLAEQLWTRFDTRYKPVETKMADECLAEGPVEPDYPAARSRGEIFASHGASQARSEFERQSRMYGLCPGADRLQALDNHDAILLTDSVNYAYRDEEHNAMVEDDMRFNRRAQLLNLGRDLLSQSAAYGSVANDILKGAADAQAATTSGAMAFLGYIRNRQETTYPEFVALSTSPGAVLGGVTTWPGLMPTPL